MPTFILFKDGARFATIVGANPVELERQVKALAA